MRARDEIQAAHDLIVKAIDEATVPMDFAQQVGFTVVLDCLCWVLKHDHPTACEDHLAVLRGEDTIPIPAGAQVH